MLCHWARRFISCLVGGKASTQTNKTNGRKREHLLTSRHKNTPEISFTRLLTYASTDSLKMVTLALTSYHEELSHKNGLYNKAVSMHIL